MLKRFFYVKLYPVIYLSFKPLLAFLSIFLILFLLGIYFGFFRAPFLSSAAEEAVPANTSFILKVKKPTDFNKKIQLLPYFNNLYAIEPFEVWLAEYSIINSILKQSKHLKNSQFEQISCLSLNGNDFVWTHIIPLPKLKIAELAKANNLSLTHKSQFLNSEIYEYSHPKYGNLVLTYSRGLFILSRQVSFVEAALVSLNNTGNNLPFDSRFREVKNNNSQIAFYANLELLPMFLSIFGAEASLATDPIFKDLSWVGGELKLEKENIVLGGKVTTKSSNSFWNWLSGQSQKGESNYADLIPENFAFVRFINVNNFKNSKVELNADFKKYVLPWLSKESIYLITEPTDKSFSSDKFFILQSKDSILSKKLITEFGNDFGILEKLIIKDKNVLKISAKSLISPVFGLDIDENSNFYCLFHKDYVVFAGSAAVLETWIENQQNDRTLVKKSQFKALAAQIKQASAATYIINNKSMLPFLKSFSNDKSDLIWSQKFNFIQQFGPIVLQLKSLGSGSFSLTASSSFQTQSIAKTETNLLWRCNLEAEAAVAPGIVYNPEKKQSEIMIQDNENRLYLITQSGEIIWKKPLDSKVMSNFQQIDFYSNGELHYIFNTFQNIYILDKKGEILNKIALASRASNGLTVVQSDKEIRIYVSCNNGKVYGYDKNGRPLSGWNPNKNCGTLNYPIQYYSNNGTKLLVALTRKGKLTLSNREGKALKTLYLDGIYTDGFFIDSIENRIVACSNTGKIDFIGFDGKRTSLASSKDIYQNVSFFYADINGDKTSDLVRLSNKNLGVQSGSDVKNLKEILKHNYSKNQTFTFAVSSKSLSKSLIGTYNTTDKEINLLDSEYKNFEGFPINSEVNFLFSDLNKDNGITLLLNSAKTLSAMKIK